MFGSDEGRICLGCWGLCFGSDEGDTVDSVLVVVVFYCQGMSCLFLGMILLCFLIISFKTEHSTWYLSKGSMSFNIFHFLFSHSRLLWWRFFLVVFWFERLSLRLIFCGLLHGLSGFRRGRPDEMCALFRLHGSITFEDILRFLRHYVHSMYTLWHYTTPRDVDCFLPQQTGSQMLTR